MMDGLPSHRICKLVGEKNDGGVKAFIYVCVSLRC